MGRRTVTDTSAAVPSDIRIRRSPRGPIGQLRICLVASFGIGILAGCSLDLVEALPDFSTVPDLVDDTLLFSTIGSGHLHTCAVSTDETTYCWGYNEYAQLGTIQPMDLCAGWPCTGEPHPVEGAPALHWVGGGTTFTCGLDGTGTAYCWGNGDSLGGIVPTDALPRKVAGGLTFERLTTHAISGAVCGVASDSLPYCWGRGSYTMPWIDSEEPVALDTTFTFASVTVAQNHMCALTPEGVAYCWGSNWAGELGIGWYGQEAAATGGDSVIPTPQVVLGGHAFTQLAASSMFTCGVTATGAVYCWGSLMHGVSSNVPKRVEPAPPFASLHVGPSRVCALTDSGDAYCWGTNHLGYLGDGTREDRTVPVRVEGGHKFAGLTVASMHTCGLAVDGRAYCWGGNPHGQIGRPGFDAPLGWRPW